MLLLILTAALAGAATALSPCVLPVLPVVVGGAVGGGRLRPVGIVCGLAIAFVAFTLTLATAIDALGIDPDVQRRLAVAVMAAFGIALLVPRVGALARRPFERIAAGVGPLAQRLAGQDGLASGLALGAALGVVWTPCAGPILAGVTAAAAAGESRTESLAVLGAYAIGAAVPMLAIAVAGRSVVARLGALSARVVRGAGVAMLAAAAVIAAGLDTRLAASVGGSAYVQVLQSIERVDALSAPLSRLRAEGDLAPSVTAARDADPLDGVEGVLPDYGPVPELVGISHWYNTPGERPLSIAGLRGRVVLLDFWTYSCVNCVRTLPHLRALHREYADDGLVVLGVHTPEFAFEADPDNVRDAVGDLDVSWPVALDPTFGTFRAYGNQYWPAEYLIDRNGHLRDLKIGEGRYEETEARVRQLLGLGVATVAERGVADETPTHRGLTPETYLGGHRLAPDQFASPERPTGRVPQRYSVPQRLRRDQFAFDGEWLVQGERATAVGGGAIEIAAWARRVYLVLSADGGPKTGRVRVDGRTPGDGIAGRDAPGGRIQVTDSRLYEVLSQPGPPTLHRIRIEVPVGVSAYAFTFG